MSATWLSSGQVRQLTKPATNEAKHDGGTQVRPSTAADHPVRVTRRAAETLVLMTERADQARASFAAIQPHLAVAELSAWRETATAIAAGLDREPVEWRDEPVAVERP